jgi:hypothetical protein
MRGCVINSHAMTVLAKIHVTHKLCMLHNFGGKILSCTCPGQVVPMCKSILQSELAAMYKCVLGVIHVGFNGVVYMPCSMDE